MSANPRAAGQSTGSSYIDPPAPTVIDTFSGRWSFLSNYSPVVLSFEGLLYPSVEHAYQAAKSCDPRTRRLIAATPDPDEAKRIGRAHVDRNDWEEAKVAVMRMLVEQKFADPGLRELLLSTGTAELREGNNWGDTFWGICGGQGANYMGLILMSVRELARNQVEPSSAPLSAAPLSATDQLGRPVRARLPTAYGVFSAWGFCSNSDGTEHLALSVGHIEGASRVLVRVHSECLTGEAFHSLRCDCGRQLDAALATIASEGMGIVLYLRGHEGRGIGLLAKLRSYALQDAGFDTVDANTFMGLPVDARNYSAAAQMLKELDIKSVRLLSNNPAKRDALAAMGIEIAEQVSLVAPATSDSMRYLVTKRDRMGHMLPALPSLSDSNLLGDCGA